MSIVNLNLQTFVTIPFAPNYEVNRKNVVRHKKTQRVLKILEKTIDGITRFYYGLRLDDGAVHYFPADSVFQKVVQSDKWLFEPVPSTNGRYELSETGVCRNATTKRILKLFNGMFSFHLGCGQRKCVSLSSLLWEVFGITDNRKNLHKKKIRVFISKDTFHKTFDSIVDAAKYLSPAIFYPIGTLRQWMTLRKSEICGYSVKYEEPDNLNLNNTTAEKILHTRRKRM